MIKQFSSIIKYINKHPLAGKHRSKAYWKFINWQVSQMMRPGTTRVPFVGNTVLMVNKGMAGATGNIYTGLHEFEDMAFLLHVLRQGDLFADIGANIGSYTILASGYIGAESVCFEPLPATYNNLQNNIIANNIAHLVTSHNIGIGSEKKHLLFTDNLDTVNHVVAGSSDSDNVIKVPVDTLDAVLNKVPLLIKIDVEGFETEVIHGMGKTLNDENLKGIIIELNGSGARYGYQEQHIHDKLLMHGFSAWTYDAFNRDLHSLNQHGAFNTLYLRDLGFIRERVKNAPKVKIFSEEF